MAGMRAMMAVVAVVMSQTFRVDGVDCWALWCCGVMALSSPKYTTLLV